MKKMFLIITAIIYCSASTAIVVQTSKNNILTIRQAQIEDFPIIKEIAIETFSKIYQLTEQEQIQNLSKIYDALFAEEIAEITNNQSTIISLVALHENTIVGYFSGQMTHQPHELYGRFVIVAPTFQKEKILNLFLRECLQKVPDTNHFLCLTKKNNKTAQNIYEHFGGKRNEHPSWISYLYKNLNAADYIGYEFDETAIINFRKNNQ